MKFTPELKLKIAQSTGLTFLADNLEKRPESEGAQVAAELRYYAPTAEALAEVNDDVLPTIKQENPGFEYDTDEPTKEYVTLTIVPTPEDAIVKINGTVGTTAKIEKGKTATYEVAKEGYTSKSELVEMTEDKTIEVTLEKVPVEKCTLTINVTPSDAKVELNGVEQKSIEVDKGTSVHIKISKEGYKTQENDKVVNKTEVLDIVLEVLPVESTYEIKQTSVTPKEPVAGKEFVAAYQLHNTTEGNTSIKHALIKFEAIEKQADVTFKATDTLGQEHTFTNSGTWGPAEGFELPAVYDVTTEFKVTTTKAGALSVKIDVIEVGTNRVICTTTDSLTIAEDKVESQYAIESTKPNKMWANEEATFNVTCKNTTVGNVAIKNVIFKFKAIEHSGDVTFKATDSEVHEFTFTNEGTWGPAEGFELPAEYNVTTPFKISMAEAGTLSVETKLVEVGTDRVIATHTETIEVLPARADKATYTIDATLPEFTASEEPTTLSIKLGTSVEGKQPISGAKLKINATHLAGQHCHFTMTDENKSPLDFTNSGIWGNNDGAGFELSGDINKTIDCQLTCPVAGQITINIELVDGEGLVLASKQIESYATDATPQTISKLKVELVDDEESYNAFVPASYRETYDYATSETSLPWIVAMFEKTAEDASIAISMQHGSENTNVVFAKSCEAIGTLSNEDKTLTCTSKSYVMFEVKNDLQLTAAIKGETLTTTVVCNEETSINKLVLPAEIANLD